MSYQKFSLDAFRTKLKTGGYANLTGANRAIGKTHELTEDEKAAARALAAKHFGGSAAAPKAAKSSKKVAKKVTKKAAKKVAKKVVAKAAAVTAPKKAAKKAGKKSAKKTTKKQSAEEPNLPKSPAAISEMTLSKAKTLTTVAATDSTGPTAVIGQMRDVVATVGQAMKSMEDAKHLFPKGTFDASVNQAVAVLGRAVEVLDTAVLAPRLAQKAANSKPMAVQEVASGDVVSSAPPVEELTDAAQLELREKSKATYDAANRGGALFSHPEVVASESQ